MLGVHKHHRDYFDNLNWLENHQVKYDTDDKIDPFEGDGSQGSGSSSESRNSSGGSTNDPNRTAENLGAVTGYNADTIMQQQAQTKELFDIADEQNKRLWENQTRQSRQQSSDEWWQQQKKLQATRNQLANSLGVNGGYGSNWATLNDLVKYADDDIDVSTLTQLRQNLNAANDDYFSSLAQNNNSRNQATMENAAALRQLYADYAAQINNMRGEANQYSSQSGYNGETWNDEPYEGMFDFPGKTLNIPGWLDQGDIWNQYKVGAAKPIYDSDLRDTDMSNAPKNNSSNTGQSANDDYWAKVKSSYGG